MPRQRALRPRLSERGQAEHRDELPARAAVAANAHVLAHAKANRIDVEARPGDAVGRRESSATGPHKGKRVRVAREARGGGVGVGVAAPHSCCAGAALAGADHARSGSHFMAHPGTSPSAGSIRTKSNMWSGASQGYEAFGLRDTPRGEVRDHQRAARGGRFALARRGQSSAWVPRQAAESSDSGPLAVRAGRRGHRARVVAHRGDLVPLLADTTRHGAGPQGVKRLAEMHFVAGAKEVLLGIHGIPDSITSPRSAERDRSRRGQT